MHILVVLLTKDSWPSEPASPYDAASQLKRENNNF